MNAGRWFNFKGIQQADGHGEQTQPRRPAASPLKVRQAVRQRAHAFHTKINYLIESNLTYFYQQKWRDAVQVAYHCVSNQRGRIPFVLLEKTKG